MTPHLSFDLPPLHPVDSNSFDTRPAALQPWLKALPVASMGETARQLYLALYEVNRTRIPLAERLAFLERLAEPLALVLPALERHYTSQPFPLSERAMRVAHLSTDLQAELVVGYRQVLETVRHLPWIRRWGTKGHKPLAAHRLLHYTNNILANFQWQYLPAPRGLWHTVHKIFQRELHRGRAHLRVMPIAGRDTSVTTEDAYKRLLLRALVPTTRMRADQWQRLDEQLNDWATLTTLSNTQTAHGFLVEPGGDKPPQELLADGPPPELEGGRFFILSTQRLVEHLDELLTTAGAILPGGITRETLQTLRDVWSGNRGRSAERHPTSGASVQMLLGVSALYHLLHGVPSRPKPRTLELQPAEHRPPPDERRAVDVWEKIYPERRLETKAWAANTAPDEPPRPVAATVVDESATGLGLLLPVHEVQAIKEADLVGIRRHPTHPWSLGFVCWLRAESEQEVAIGVQYLATDAFPVEITVGRSAPIGCLLGSAHDGQSLLFMPYIAGIEQKPLQLVFHGTTTPITLLQRMNNSGEFVSLSFAFPDTAETRPATAAQLHDKLGAPVAAAAQAERFSDIWSSL